MPELLLGPLQADVRKMVERAVVQTTDVGHQADLDRLALAGGRARRAGARAGRVELSLLEPQAATPSASAAQPASASARNFMFTVLPSSWDAWVSARDYNLAASWVFTLVVAECGIDRGCGNRLKRSFIEAQRLACAMSYSPPIDAPKYGRVVAAERDPHAGVGELAQRVLLVGREDAEHDVAGRTALERDPALRELVDERRILDRAHPVADARDRQLERRADALRPGPLARVHRAAQPGRPRRSRRARRTAAPGSSARRRPSRSRRRRGAGARRRGGRRAAPARRRSCARRRSGSAPRCRGRGRRRCRARSRRDARRR